MHLIHPDDHQSYNEMIRPALREGRNFDSEFRVVLPDGGVRWLHALGRPVVAADGATSMVRGTLRDITEQRETDEHIRHLAHFDTLTGLPNRSLFNHLLGVRSTRRAVAARRWPCSSSTWMASRRSTTSWGTTRATRCWRNSPPAERGAAPL
jgi:hypothetical protein